MVKDKTPDFIASDGFKFEDLRQFEIYKYLNRLVSEGAASFYKDACRLMTTKPLFETTTHLVSHLLREIESAMRAVLESISEPFTEDEESHKNQIRIMLKALGISNEDPIAKAWLRIAGDNGLHGMAHRNNLDRARPLNDKFWERWNEINLILIVILERFESQYNRIFAILDQLALIEKPKKAEVKILRLHIPNNRVAHNHFFNVLSSPGWLPILESNGFFEFPPKPEINIENGELVHYDWPVIKYLLKVANVSNKQVTKILKNIPPTDNIIVNAKLLEVATLLPKERKLELLPNVKQWINSNDRFYNPSKIADFIITLNDDNEFDAALDLSTELLKFEDQPTSVSPLEGIDWIPPQEPKPFVEKWQYSRFLKDKFHLISQNIPLKSLNLICGTLAKYYEIKRGYNSKIAQEDFSYIIRPSIEIRDRIYQDDIVNSLIDSIIDISIDAIDKTPTFLNDVLSELKSYNWPIFKRITVHLLSKFPEIMPENTIDTLIDVSLSDNLNYEHEYALLASTGFHLLNNEQKSYIFRYIKSGKARRKVLRKYSKPNDDLSKDIKYWQRDKLAIFAPHLEGDEKNLYENLVSELGIGIDPLIDRGTRVHIGPVSDVTAADLGKMASSEIIEFLKTWQPTAREFGFGPSKEGLGRELKIAVKNDLSKFSEIANQFIELDQEYISNYFMAFSEGLKNETTFNWIPIIDLSLWVTMQNSEDSYDNSIVDIDKKIDWSWAKICVVSFISDGLNGNKIPYELHDQIWEIMEILSNDINPTPEKEAKMAEALKEDSFSVAINSVRSKAISTGIEFCLWNRKQIEQLKKEKNLGAISKIDYLAKLLVILENHLIDPSIAVRSIYGRYFPWILSLNKDWMIAHTNDIFPKDGFDTPYYDSAWQTYIGYVPVYTDVFKILETNYFEAVKNIDVGIKRKVHYIDTDKKLIEDLMKLYWQGMLDLNIENGMFRTFWRNANEDSRAYAIEYIGHSLHNTKEPIGKQSSKLLKELWEFRMNEVKNCQNKSVYEKEVIVFGWWFASGKFDNDWSIKEYEKSLDISNNIDPDYFVIERLEILADTKPLESINILKKLLHPGVQNLSYLGIEENLKSIFIKVLDSENTKAQTIAKELINRLLAWGNNNYSYLLKD